MQLAGLLLASCSGAASAAASTPPEPLFELHSAVAEPVIDRARAHALPGGPNSGFEGGLYFRAADGVYHLFPSECMLDRPKVPWDIHMESHDWTSRDGTNWTRGEMIYDSSGKMDGSDRRGAIWAPMPVYDDDSERWNLFCEPPPNPSPTTHSSTEGVCGLCTDVGYTCDPGQVDGAIYRLISQTAGPSGVAGPYPRDNATIVLDLEGAGGKSAHWEGTAKDQGDDSFFPWRLDNGTWVGFFGVHDKTGDTGGKVHPPLSLCLCCRQQAWIS